MRFSDSRSCFFRSESFLNYQISQSTDVATLKTILQGLISETKSLHNTLSLRCSKVKEILSLLQAHIQFDEHLFLKEKDVERMNAHIA